LAILSYERAGPAVTIRLNRPAQLNALSGELIRQLADAVGRFDADDEARVAVIIGEGGRAFSAGADLKELAARPVDPEAQAGVSARFLRELEECSKPVVAAIDGYALGGGLEIALLCDIRVATEQSRFGLPEPRRSLLAGPGLHYLSRLIPLGEALHLQLTGGMMSARRAHDIGLVQRLVADRAGLLSEVAALVEEITLCAPLAVEAIKHIVRTGHELTLDQARSLAEPIEREIAGTDDSIEGPRAFAEGRPPLWQRR
jgi:enoyl-CoA hydratase/carnithine racemase